ncbi:uncharacterized protein VTP21DRAFT_7106 [Calcarisporiella thermophila]|uniref:uncharacterized protein n=1 Tax=Calcarisporiella thermophila TaxID=911321 RepID=UPI003743856A
MEQASTAHSEIERCLALLRPGTSDESKFVALLLLPRLLNQENPESVRRVFNGMNFKFLERLMKTKAKPEQEIPESTFRSIAVSILYCFSMVDELAQTEELTERIPTLSKLIEPNDATEVTEDILRIYIRLSAGEKGLEKILEKDILLRIISILDMSKSEVEKELALRLLEHISIGLVSREHPKLSFFFEAVLPALSATFKSQHDKLKIDLLEWFGRVFEHIPPQAFTAVPAGSDWPSNLKEGLRQLLTTKLPSPTRDTALCLTASLLRHLSPRWLFVDLAQPTPRQSEKMRLDKAVERENAEKFAALVIHLACVEIRLFLDEEGELRSKSKSTEGPREKARVLVSCYEILENALTYLGVVADREETLGYEMLLKIQGNLVETFRAIMEFLADMRDLYGDQGVPQLANDPLISASIRILSAWLSEDASLEEETVTILPFLLQFCQYSIPSPQHAEPPIDFTQLLAPAFAHFASTSDKARAALIDFGAPLILAEYVASVWNRQELKALTGPVQVLAVLISRDTAVDIGGGPWEKLGEIGTHILETLGMELLESSAEDDWAFLVVYTHLLMLSLIRRRPQLAQRDFMESFTEKAFLRWDQQGSKKDELGVTEALEELRKVWSDISKS